MLWLYIVAIFKEYLYTNKYMALKHNVTHSKWQVVHFKTQHNFVIKYMILTNKID